MISEPSRDETPDLFTVEEAAQVLRIGRTAAYQLAQRDLATYGAEGLHVVRVGRLLRVPRSALEALAGGPITLPSSSAAVTVVAAPGTSSATTDADRVDDVTAIAEPTRDARPSRTEAATTAKHRSDQLTLPFAS